MQRPVFFLAAMLCLFSVEAGAAEAEPISLHYYERPPFFFPQPDGRPAGVIVDIAMKAFGMAGIRLEWHLTPQSRILSILRENRGRDCSLGWFKTPEREAFARFSIAAHWEKPFVGLVPANAPFPEDMTAKELFARPGIKVLVRQATSYGAYLDRLIAGLPPSQIVRQTGALAQMVKQVQSGHADVMIEIPEEFDIDLANAKVAPADVRLLHFPDVAGPEPSYVMCSRNVAPDVIKRLDDALRNLSERK